MSMKVVTFGEVMMRLSPPGHAKFSQATQLELVYGGGEANVAISLAYMGLEAIHVTRFPDNLIGRAASQFLRHHWIDTSAIQYGGQFMGKYFLEKGAVHRPSEVVYEREGSSFAEVEPGMFDWQAILEGASWFHWTGITPAISDGAAKSCQEAIKVANDMGITVSSDIHSRKNLWQYGKKEKEVIPQLAQGCDVIIGSARGITQIFGLGEEYVDDFGAAASQLQAITPRVKKVFDKHREAVSASHNRIHGMMWNGAEILETPQLDVTHIIDRVGTGDAYAAGVIYGLLKYSEDLDALKFATAACALKHTVEGDANMVSADNVANVMDGDTAGNIIR